MFNLKNFFSSFNASSIEALEMSEDALSGALDILNKSETVQLLSAIPSIEEIINNYSLKEISRKSARSAQKVLSAINSDLERAVDLFMGLLGEDPDGYNTLLKAVATLLVKGIAIKLFAVLVLKIATLFLAFAFLIQLFICSVLYYALLTGSYTTVYAGLAILVGGAVAVALDKLEEYNDFMFTTKEDKE